MDHHLTLADYKNKLSEIATLDFNYDEQAYLMSRKKIGWNIDEYESIVAAEPPGEPLANGPFAIIKDAIADYDFADPGLIQVAFDPETPLLGRNIVMVARFLPFRFTFGVRVTNVIDKPTDGDTLVPDATTWGFCYRTLKGHFEVGQICFYVIKHHASGEIRVRIHAHSKPDKISNPIFRLGFRVFGRSLQKKFARDAITNLRQLAEGKNPTRQSPKDLSKTN